MQRTKIGLVFLLFILLGTAAWTTSHLNGKYKFFFKSSWVEEPRYPYQYNKFDFFKLEEAQQEERLSTLLNLEKVDIKQGVAVVSEAVSKKLMHQLINSTLLAETYEGFYNSPDNKGAIKTRYYNDIYSAPYPLDYEGEMTFVEMLYHIDRRPSKLKQNYREWSPLAFELISKERYANSGLKLYTESLLKTEAYLKDKDYEALFAKLKEAEETSDHPFCGPIVCPDMWQGYLDPEIKHTFMHDCKEPDPDFGTYCNYRDVMWFHSFWYRRYLEGNWNVTKDILLDIQAHYAEE